MESHLRAISLFSGCGGFDWGAQEAGVEIIWANDIDPHAASAYKLLFPHVKFVDGDICDVQEFPEADVIIGCYPCTGFSVGARRRWRDRERNLQNIDNNFLYKEFLRALKQVKPKYFFVENVRGMQSADKGWFFQEQLNGFHNAGYKVQHSLLDASWYGSVQNRKRIFFAGVRNDLQDFEYKFASPTHGAKGTKPFLKLRDVIWGLDEWPEGEFCDLEFHGHYLTRNRKRSWDDLSYTIVAHAHHVPLHPAGEPMIYVSKDKWSLQGNYNRRLSWRECRLIQGLPPLSFSEDTSLFNKYRVIGNAVPPIFGKILLKPIVEYEKGSLIKNL